MCEYEILFKTTIPADSINEKQVLCVWEMCELRRVKWVDESSIYGEKLYLCMFRTLVMESVLLYDVNGDKKWRLVVWGDRHGCWVG